MRYKGIAPPMIWTSSDPARLPTKDGLFLYPSFDYHPENETKSRHWAVILKHGLKSSNWRFVRPVIRDCTLNRIVWNPLSIFDSTRHKYCVR